MSAACAVLFFVQTFVFAVAAIYSAKQKNDGAAIVGIVLAAVNLVGYVIAMHLWLKPRQRES